MDREIKCWYVYCVRLMPSLPNKKRKRAQSNTNTAQSTINADTYANAMIEDDVGKENVVASQPTTHTTTHKTTTPPPKKMIVSFL
jgi:hypothetical protein